MLIYSLHLFNGSEEYFGTFHVENIISCLKVKTDKYFKNSSVLYFLCMKK